jgi:hypothetical protein
MRNRIGADELLRRLQLGALIAFELRIEDGERKPVSINDWCSEYASEMLKSGRKYHSFNHEPPEDPAAPREVFSYGSAGRLLLVEKAQNETLATAVGREKGRPPAEAWADVAAVAAIYLYENGLPKTANELVKHIQERCNDAIGETTTKAFVSKLISAVKGKVK